MNAYADSDLDRALLGQPSKTVEAAMRAEKRPKWQTEFDDELAPLKRMIFKRIVIGAVIFFGVEAFLIFGVLSQTDVRLQSSNGALVFIAAIAGFFISLLMFLLPTKRMGYESLKLIRETRQLGVDGAARTEKTFERMEQKVTDGMTTMGARFAGIEKELRKFNEPDAIDYDLITKGERP